MLTEDYVVFFFRARATNNIFATACVISSLRMEENS